MKLRVKVMTTARPKCWRKNRRRKRWVKISERKILNKIHKKKTRTDKVENGDEV